MGQVGLGNDLAEDVAFGHEGHEDEASKFRHLLKASDLKNLSENLKL